MNCFAVKKLKGKKKMIGQFFPSILKLYIFLTFLGGSCILPISVWL